jgi:hypothetical protein
MIGKCGTLFVTSNCHTTVALDNALILVKHETLKPRNGVMAYLTKVRICIQDLAAF